MHSTLWVHPIFAPFRLLTLILRYPCWVWHSTVRKLIENIGKLWTKPWSWKKTLGRAFHHSSMLECMNTEYYNLWRKCKIHTKQEQICDWYKSQNQQYSNVFSHVPMREFLTNRFNISSHPAKLVSVSPAPNRTKIHLLWKMHLQKNFSDLPV